MSCCVLLYVNSCCVSCVVLCLRCAFAVVFHCASSVVCVVGCWCVVCSVSYVICGVRYLLCVVV